MTVRDPCTWTEELQVDDLAWRTACGNLFQFTADGPRENGFKFCPYCGGELRQGDYTESEYDEVRADDINQT